MATNRVYVPLTNPNFEFSQGNNCKHMHYTILYYTMFPAPQQPNNNKPLGEFWMTMQFLDIVFLNIIQK